MRQTRHNASGIKAPIIVRDRFLKLLRFVLSRDFCSVCQVCHPSRSVRTFVLHCGRLFLESLCLRNVNLSSYGFLSPVLPAQ